MGKNIVNMFVSSNFNFKTSIKNLKFYNEIKNSGLFDEEYYKNVLTIQLNPDVKKDDVKIIEYMHN